MASKIRLRSIWVALFLAMSLIAAACGEDGGDGGEVSAGGDAQDAEAATPGAEAEGAEAEGAETEGATATDGYPERPITWIVAFDPGGGSDTEFRRMQPHLEELLGQRIEVQYRPGAGGGVGWAELANAEPDGYTIGGIVIPHIILQPLLQDDVGFSTDDFELISINAEAPQALIVSEDDPAFESFEDWAAAVEERPGTVDIGASALFNLSHAIAVQLRQEGLEANYVSTGEGATAVVTGVRGGHFASGMLGANHAVTNEGVRAIAVSGEDRYFALPDVPTFQELGYDVSGTTSWGVAAPAGTPQEVLDTLSDAMLEALARDDVLASIEEEGQQPLALGPDEAAEYVSQTRQRYESIVPLLEEDAD